MPFTISHAAAVLPLQRFGRYTLPLSALMVGSMAPDFGYFFSREISRQLTHSFIGLFTFALPGGLAVWLFYVAVLEKTTITLLPGRWHTRFAHTDAITPGLIGRATIAIVLGAVTHILWDAFTHRGTFITDAVPMLMRPTPGFEWMPIYHLLQGLSSVVGLLALAVWVHRLHRQPVRSQIRPYDISESVRMGAIWFLTVVTLAVGLVYWLPYQFAHYSAQIFYLAVGLMSGFFVAWCLIAVALMMRAHRRRARDA